MVLWNDLDTAHLHVVTYVLYLLQRIKLKEQKVMQCKRMWINFGIKMNFRVLRENWTSIDRDLAIPPLNEDGCKTLPRLYFFMSKIEFKGFLQ